MGAWSLSRQLEHLGARLARALAAEDHDLLGPGDQAPRRGRGRASVGRITGRCVMIGWFISSCSHLGRGDVAGQDDQPDAAAEDRRLERQLRDARHLARPSRSCRRSCSAPSKMNSGFVSWK